MPSQLQQQDPHTDVEDWRCYNATDYETYALPVEPRHVEAMIQNVIEWMATA